MKPEGHPRKKAALLAVRNVFVSMQKSLQHFFRSMRLLNFVLNNCTSASCKFRRRNKCVGLSLSGFSAVGLRKAQTSMQRLRSILLVGYISSNSYMLKLKRRRNETNRFSAGRLVIFKEKHILYTRVFQHLKGQFVLRPSALLCAARVTLTCATYP